MNKNNIIHSENLADKFSELQKKSRFTEIANLLSYSLLNNSSLLNQQVFGYIPQIFREIEINNHTEFIQSKDIYLGEPIIYKFFFPSEHTLAEIPFFYIFCYLKENTSQLNVFFQSAAKNSSVLTQKDYSLSSKKITFEGIISAFTQKESTICISDPGHFIPGLTSSFYAGNKNINFARLISNIIESICHIAQINLQDTFLFGSSAGSVGALLSSTYFSSKVQVMSVNSQIYTYGLLSVMRALFETSERQTLLKKFGNQVCCRYRFQQNINSVPNIYILANLNDKLHGRNYAFYQLYQKLFSDINQNNQSVFDSYQGVEGHGRPDKDSLKKKILMARQSLTMNSNVVEQLCCPPSVSSKRRQRIKYLKKVINNISELKILEIGAFDNPTFLKEEANIYYCDYFSREELEKKYAKDKPQRAEKAVNVDYVIKEEKYSDRLNQKFDLVIANHVIEHIPNMIAWLQDISLILRKDGFLFLTIPHKEYTFDKLRSVTSLQQLIRNYYDNLKAPTLYHIFDQLYYHRPIKAGDVWNNNYQHLLNKKRFNNIDAAWHEAQKRLSNSGYVDVHCNVFSYESFINIINELQNSQYISLNLYSHSDVAKPSNEFYILLKN